MSFSLSGNLYGSGAAGGWPSQVPTNQSDLKSEVRQMLDTSGSKCDNVFGTVLGGSVRQAINLIEEFIGAYIYQHIRDKVTAPPPALSQRDFYDLHGWLMAEARSITHAGFGCNKQDRMVAAMRFVQKKFDNSSYQSFVEWFENEYAKRAKRASVGGDLLNGLGNVLGVGPLGDLLLGTDEPQPPTEPIDTGGFSLAGMPWLQIILLASVGLGTLIFIDKNRG